METSITLIFAPELSYIFRTSGGGPNCEGRLCFIWHITEIVSWSMYYWSIYLHLSLKSSSGGSKTVGNGMPVIPDRGSLRKNGNKIQVEKYKAGGGKIKKKRNISSKRAAATCVWSCLSDWIQNVTFSPTAKRFKGAQQRVCVPSRPPQLKSITLMTSASPP